MHPLLAAAVDFLVITSASSSDSDSDDDSSDETRTNEHLLEELGDMDDFEERVAHASKIKHWKLLGEGSSRTIFKISESLVLKIAHNDKGIAQNKAEMSMRAPCLNNVLAADSEGKWVIVRFTETMKEKDFKDYTGFGFDPFFKAVHYSFNNEDHDDKPREYEEIVESPLYKSLADLVLKQQLQIGDCAKINSWGMLGSTPVLRDFGLTKDIFAEHYKSDSSSTSPTSSKHQGHPSSST